MNPQQPGPSTATPPSPKLLRPSSLPTATASPERSVFWTFAVIGTVVLAVGIGVLLPVVLQRFSTPDKAIAATPETPKPSESKDHSLETIGSLAAANLYQGYLNIGLLADAHENEIYQVAEAEKLLDSVTSMLDAVDRRLEKLVNDGLKDEDKEAVEQARNLSNLLLVQARELRTYWKTGVKDHADKFQKARQQSWSGVQALLGIED